MSLSASRPIHVTMLAQAITAAAVVELICMMSQAGKEAGDVLKTSGVITLGHVAGSYPLHWERDGEFRRQAGGSGGMSSNQRECYGSCC